MSGFFGDLSTEDAIAPVVYGHSAGLNSAMFFACPECGACVVDMEFTEVNRRRHDEWHRSRA